MLHNPGVGSNTRFSRLDKFEYRLRDSGQAGKCSSRSQYAIQRNHRRKITERHDIPERRAGYLTESVLKQNILIGHNMDSDLRALRVSDSIKMIRRVCLVTFVCCITLVDPRNGG